jgi:hypothetical protein
MTLQGNEWVGYDCKENKRREGVSVKNAGGDSRSRLPGGEDEGEERDEGVRERRKRLPRAGELAAQEACREGGSVGGVALACSGSKEDGEDAAIEGGRGRGAISGSLLAATFLPLRLLPVSIHGARVHLAWRRSWSFLVGDPRGSKNGGSTCLNSENGKCVGARRHGALISVKLKVFFS